MTTTRFAAIVALILAGFGYVGEMDYQAKASAACEAKGGEWDGEVCNIHHQQK